MTGMACSTVGPSSAAAATRGGWGRKASTKRNASAVLTYFLARRARASGRIITLLLEPNATGLESAPTFGIADDARGVPRGKVGLRGGRARLRFGESFSTGETGPPSGRGLPHSVLDIV